MEKLSLCISCLNGEWTALGMRKGAPTGSWQKPEPVDDFAGLARILEQSIAQTEADGRAIGIVIAHPKLTNHVVDVPPVKGAKLTRYIERRLQQLKTFEGDATWSHQRAMAAKGVDSALVHLFPKLLFEQIHSASREAGGRLVRLLPTTAVLANQLKELPLEKDELALLAAETGPSTTIVIGRRDGRVCLSRILRGGWSAQADRVAVDISRTIGFAEQQTGLTVNSVWLFGPNVEARLPEMQTLLRLPVKPSPVKHTRLYWCMQASQLAAREDANLVSVAAQEAPQRWRRLTVTSAALLLLLLGSLGVAGYAERQLRSDRRTIVALDAEIARWQRTKSEWQTRHADAARKRALVRIVSEEQPLSVPAWFLGYLGDATPRDLLLTRLEIKRTNAAWTVRLAGTAQPTTNNSPQVVFQEAVAELATNLANGPFHLKLVQNGPADDKAKPARTPAPPVSLTFNMEGMIR
jgi:hypothetical protein